MKPVPVIVILTLVAGSLLSGCGSGSSNTPAPRAGGNLTTPAPQPEAAQIPEGAKYTIVCRSFADFSEARMAKENLTSMTGKRDWYIVSGGNQTTLYYGFYRSSGTENDRESERVRKDQKWIVALEVNGRKLFPLTRVVPLDTGDPAAPAEWNLLNARGRWTLQVAAWDSADRKEVAVDGCREFRKRGEEAYYYHGPSVSSLCIGLWPESAIRMIDADVKPDTDDQVVYVLPETMNLSETQRARIEKYGAMTPDGRPVKIAQPRFKITDPAIFAKMRQYPHHYINGPDPVGRKIRIGGVEEFIADPSYIVAVPQNEMPRVAGNPFGGPQPGAVRDPNSPVPPTALPMPGLPGGSSSTTNRPAGGRLKSIGE